jgi:Cu(I)/Ag(I) efflux system membrane fusion protein
MFANVEIIGNDLGMSPVVPENAVIRSGMKNIVIISLGDGKFKPQEVQLGGYSDGYYQVQNGLTEGNTIVTSAQFLIDSESNLKAALNQFKFAKPDTAAILNMKEEKPEMKNEKQELPDAKHNHSSSIVREGVIDVNSIDKNNDGKLFECPMDWNVISDESGRCPECNMKLKEYSIDEAKANLDKYGYEYKK